MGDKVMLTVEERKILGKKVAKLRKEGFVPAVVYGHGVEATSVMAPANVLEKVWHEAGKHHPVELTIGEHKRLAMIKSADLHPVKRNLRHMSFHVVKQNEKVETDVPVHILGEGETEAERMGLVVLKAVETVQISALPKNLPDAMQVPGDKLAAAGDHLTVADIIPIDGVTITTDPAIVVVTVYEPSALAAQNDAAGGDAEVADASEVDADKGAATPEAEAEVTSAEQQNGKKS